jgi:hypothetical protein
MQLNNFQSKQQLANTDNKTIYIDKCHKKEDKKPLNFFDKLAVLIVKKKYSSFK